ncbi:MAG TPA: MqnA/MqnD/SBP family protein [Candidatus Nitrosopolaris sp.]|nr:MqnA/MqnD/SBP family protein [Candidatus Nitrosopolaris sp.]
MLGHTPDADDAFMFYGIEAHKVESPHFKIKHVIEDIETLNNHALKHELDVTAVSAHAFAYLKDYIILRSGASFGYNYGPIVVSKKELSLSQLKESTIAIPGKMTSANLLLNLVLGKFNEQEINFQLIPNAVLSDKVDAGLVIHEMQITYYKSHLYNILDLGAWWHTETNGLPVPLGINVASIKSMTTQEIRWFNNLFKTSILYGLEHKNAAVDYAMRYSRGQPKQVMRKFIKMYVNDITVDMGPIGEKAIKKMFRMGQEKGILPLISHLNFV